MVILSDFRMGKQRDDDHEEDAPYFSYHFDHKSLISAKFRIIKRSSFINVSLKRFGSKWHQFHFLNHNKIGNFFSKIEISTIH